jgi:DNA-binding GntR family transcriptional regulator
MMTQRKPKSPSPAPRPPQRVSRARPALTEEQVYDRIHGAVLDHRLLPGTKLKEVALAEVFGVNRNVVRRVLARLAFAKLVDQKPNRGATVATPTIAESCDLFAARRAVEGAIVDIATRRIGAGETRKLRALAQKERETYARGDSRAGLKMSLQFHRDLAAIAGNRVLAELLDQLMARTPLVILAFQGRGTGNRCNDDEHGAIVDAMASGNPAKAVAAMTAHLSSLESALDLTVRGEPRTDLAELFLQQPE